MDSSHLKRPQSPERILDRGEPPSQWGRAIIVDIDGSQNFGVLAAFLPPGTTTTGAEERLLRAYARHAASVLETAHALERARIDRDAAQVLLQLAHGLARAHTSSEIAATIVPAARHLLGADNATVWSWEPDDNVLHLVAAQPELSDTPRSYDPVQAPALLALRANPRPLLVPASKSKHIKQLMGHLGIETVAYVPVVARDQFLGLIAVGFNKPLGQLSHDDILERLAGLADLASAALDNARLLERIQHEASHDALTRLPNRTVATAAARASLMTSPDGTGLLFIDLNDFKKINDVHGHHFGDQLLTVVAARMGSCMRANDTLTRFAGDEFVVVVSDCKSQADAQDVANRITATLQHPVMVDGQLVSIAASVGVAFATSQSGDFESMLNAADSAMYINKRKAPDALHPVRQRS